MPRRCRRLSAGVVPTIGNLDAQPRHELIWGASGFPFAYTGDDLIVYGHWNNATLDANGWPGPKFLNNTIGLDTSAFGVVTGIRLPDRRVFQSAQYASAMASGKWKGNQAGLLRASARAPSASMLGRM